jgi:hypothetical protein
VRTASVTPELLGFPHAAQVVEITRESTRKKTGETTTGCRRFVLSEPLSARDGLLACRGRWGVENKNHHPRDATWLEDKTRAAAGHTAANLMLLRGLALVWWRKNHSQLSAPQFLARNQTRRSAALHELFQPLKS